MLITIPANSQTYEIPQFFTIVDDNIDEDQQSFAIVAEIGSDVPDGVSCFQIATGDIGCRGRRGAVEIKITDNDGKFVVSLYSICRNTYCVRLLAMIIGFTERIRTVSEGQVRGVDLFQLQINVTSARTAEREHPMVFRLQESVTNATIETYTSSRPVFDATFGRRENSDDPIETTRDLDPGSLTLGPTLLTTIRNDLVPEDTECFTIRIFPVDVPGRRELFECNEDSDDADNYFCEHTICIEDDDGEGLQFLLLLV